MSKVLEAAGLPNEYNTATFKSYSYVLDPVSTLVTVFSSPNCSISLISNRLTPFHSTVFFICNLQSTAFQKFFQDPEVQEALHVRGYNLPGLIFEPELPKHMDAITQDDDAFPHGAADAESHHHNVHHHHHHNHEDDDRGGTHFHHDYDDAVADDHGDDSDDFDDDDDDTYKGVYFKPPLGWQVCNDELVSEMSTFCISHAEMKVTSCLHSFFFEQNDQMRADHPVSIVPTLQFLAEAPPVTDSFKAKNGENRRGLAEAVRSSVRVLLYSGEFDLNCNTLGTLHTLEANTWIGR